MTRPWVTLPWESRSDCATSTVRRPLMPGPVVREMRSIVTWGEEPTVSSRTTVFIGLPSLSWNQMLCAAASEYWQVIASEASELCRVCVNSMRLGRVVGLGEAARSWSTKIAMLHLYWLLLTPSAVWKDFENRLTTSMSNENAR